MTESPSSVELVRHVVLAADRRRRSVEATRALARFAPVGAGVCLAIAVVGHLAAWPLPATLVLAMVVVGAVLAATWLAGRAGPLSDTIAARIDGDAALGGELRSAYWFTAHESPDEWTSFHIEQAAVRARDVNWRQVYPPVAANRAWIATAALVIAAFVLPAGVPSWPSSVSPVPVSAARAELVEDIGSLPPELQQQLLEILDAVRAGRLTPEEAVAKARDLTGFAKLDEDLRKQIEDSLRDAKTEAEEAARASAPESASGQQNTADVQWARENMASRLANEEAQRADSESKPEEEGPSSAQTEDPALGETGEASTGQAAARVPTKDAAGSEGSTGMMRNGAIGDPGSAFGGKKGNVRYGTSEAQELAAALKKEQIEAIANLDNSNIKTDDKRRRAEQGWSALSYTRVAGRSTFDRARTDAPRLVPEARRPLLERYFVRQATPDAPPATAQPATAPPAGRVP